MALTGSGLRHDAFAGRPTAVDGGQVTPYDLFVIAAVLGVPVLSRGT